jgi:hypothetical protein
MFSKIKIKRKPGDRSCQPNCQVGYTAPEMELPSGFPVSGLSIKTVSGKGGGSCRKNAKRYNNNTLVSGIKNNYRSVSKSRHYKLANSPFFHANIFARPLQGFL